ncbi:histidine phosphatase family protein [bacterium]|nr:histidine phosphatase family protein [bacterium]MBU1995403.1 histidine phosphatase family protein [bacterium]
MKKLYIIRHAKSDWEDLSLSDFERPLNKRGKKNAPFMSKILKQKGVLPDAILSSPALRAKTTAQLFAKGIDFKKNIIYKENMYEADTGQLREILMMLSDADNKVFLFGHNPGFNMLVESFVNFHENIPTCGIVEIAFECKKWSQINASNAKLISFDYPKKY